MAVFRANRMTAFAAALVIVFMVVASFAAVPIYQFSGIWLPKGVQTFNSWGLPFLNTLILLASVTTLTWAHHGLIDDYRRDLVRGLAATIALGIIFILIQAYEFTHAAFGFKEGSYYTTFYMATGFHGFHVIVGTIILIVCLVRTVKGHFKPDHHDDFEVVTWYWYFINLVWLFLFFSIHWWGS
jgi:cytochrome c oxidase subunit 3